ncbi:MULTISPECIES: hypothetical protein [Vibrio harveyi group]|nr:hypothetical protein [Vibrio parahaemolyticus]EJG0872244.1 hypothetical protein [Vibrio parahaemolyticus O3]EJG0900903.1 hypothetical protein [Vibrio parahaemolyticus O3:K56]EJG0920351.1 hypothetical protein [Vibrio parahaemolyticus O1:K68]EJG0929966.1 hypothetical protein [Vibrio parahaemolyticus O1]EJG0944178.1 hypothetical protein [Vibrio parahaemolyticus O10]EJG1072997.1 hypothetical protein [Vibrio parahaemolyticus O1:K56]EQM46894.1 hypothetical protein D051_3616 [Vibrio parahaemolyt
MNTDSNGYVETYIEPQTGIVADLKKRPGQKALPLKCDVADIEWFGKVRPLHELDLPGEPADFFIQFGLHVFSFECEGNWIQYVIDPTKTKSREDFKEISNAWNDHFKTVEEREYFCMNPSCTEYMVPSSYSCDCDGAY